jgi:RES domain-containing protein
MTGAGAAYSPGRWNKQGEMVVYAASTLAMAVLETAAHIDDSGLPLNKYVIEIDVPDDVWAVRLVMPAAALQVGWDAIPHGMISVDAGSAWYTAGAHAIIELPSVIAPEETIVLINAQHPDSQRMVARATRRFQYNLLFRNSR